MVEMTTHYKHSARRRWRMWTRQWMAACGFRKDWRHKNTGPDSHVIDVIYHAWLPRSAGRTKRHFSHCSYKVQCAVSAIKNNNKKSKNKNNFSNWKNNGSVKIVTASANTETNTPNAASEETLKASKNRRRQKQMRKAEGRKAQQQRAPTTVNWRPGRPIGGI